MCESMCSAEEAEEARAALAEETKVYVDELEKTKVPQHTHIQQL